MPESALAAAKAAAEAKELEGYLLTLDIPSYLPVLTYCDNQALRKELYEAYVTRASDRGPTAGQWGQHGYHFRAAENCVTKLHACLALVPSVRNHWRPKWPRAQHKCLVS